MPVSTLGEASDTTNTNPQATDDMVGDLETHNIIHLASCIDGFDPASGHQQSPSHAERNHVPENLGQTYSARLCNVSVRDVLASIRNSDDTESPADLGQSKTINGSFIHGLGVVYITALSRMKSQNAPMRKDSRLNPDSEPCAVNDFRQDMVSLIVQSELDLGLELWLEDQETEFRTREKFLSEAKSYLRLDDTSMGILTDELNSFYFASIQRQHTAARNHVIRLLNKSYAFSLRVCLGCKEHELAQLEKGICEVGQDSSTLQNDLLQLQTKFKQQLLNCEKLLQFEKTDQARRLTEDLKESLSPVRKIMDMLDLSLKQGKELAQKLQARVVKLSTNLATSERLSQEAHHAQENTKAELELAHDVNSKLRKSVESERINMYNKYHKDVENRVELRVQEEKAKLAARLYDAEAKARQHDIAVSRTLELEKQIEDLTHENAKHVSAKLNLNSKYKELKEERGATQQGYEQMRYGKDQAELRVSILETELHNLRLGKDCHSRDVDMTDSVGRECLDQTTRDQTPVTPVVKIMTHSEKLTESDRLYMIAQKWRTDLLRAESEGSKHEHALKNTDTQITFALRQLKVIDTRKANRVGTGGSRAARRAPEDVRSVGTERSSLVSQYTADPLTTETADNKTNHATVDTTSKQPLWEKVRQPTTRKHMPRLTSVEDFPPLAPSSSPSSSSSSSARK